MASLTIPAGFFAQRKVMIGTPMYGGQCFGRFMTACLNLQKRLMEAGISHGFVHVYNESLVPRSRNKLAAKLLAEGYTDLVFLDADIDFTPDDVIYLLALPLDMVGATYAKKRIEWERVIAAVKANPDIPPADLAQVATTGVKSFLADGEVRLDEPLEVKELGTGMLRITRTVFEQIRDRWPELEYTPMPDEPQGAHYDFFGVGKWQGENYLSEDYWFEAHWRALGGKLWMCPWMVTRHIGVHEYACNLGLAAQYLKSI